MSSDTSEHFRHRLLGGSAEARGSYLNDALYHASVELTCTVLDVVDSEVLSAGTRLRIADKLAAAFRPVTL